MEHMNEPSMKLSLEKESTESMDISVAIPLVTQQRPPLQAPLHYRQWRKLPTVIYLVVREYISRTEYLQLLNSSKELFHEIKRETIFYNLGFTASILYCNDLKFRQFILNQVIDKSKQIALDLYSHYHKHLHKFYQLAEGVQKLMIRDLEVASIDLFSTIEELTVQSIEKLKVINHLERVRIFRVYDCPKLSKIFPSSGGTPHGLQEVFIANCPALRNSRGLETVPLLTFQYCRNLCDISNLGIHQRQVVFRGCPKIIKVNHLKNVYELSFVDCAEISDISELGNVPIMQIANCPKLDSIVALNNRRLSIALLPGVTSFHNFSNCEKVELASLKIVDLTNGDFSRCCEFHLRSCDQIVDVFPLRSIEKIHLFSCHLIVDISCLSQVQDLSISVCRGLTNLKGLGNVPKLSVYLCEKLQDISALGMNQNVFISACVNIRDFSSLQGIKTVTLIDCPQLQTAACVHSVRNLKLERCYQLEDVSMLGMVDSLELIHCPKVLSLRGLGTVRKLRVISCKVEDVAELDGKCNVTIK